MLLIFISWTIKPSRDQSGFPSRPQFSAGVECALSRKPCQTSDSIENTLLYSPICCLSSLLNHILDRTDTLVGPAWKTLSPSEGVYQVAHWKRILLPVQETQVRGFNPWVRKIPWRWQWQPTPVFLPGESHGQRSLVLQSLRSQRVGYDWAHSPRPLYMAVVTVFYNSVFSYIWLRTNTTTLQVRSYHLRAGVSSLTPHSFSRIDFTYRWWENAAEGRR